MSDMKYQGLLFTGSYKDLFILTEYFSETCDRLTFLGNAKHEVFIMHALYSIEKRLQRIYH